MKSTEISENLGILMNCILKKLTRKTIQKNEKVENEKHNEFSHTYPSPLFQLKLIYSENIVEGKFIVSYCMSDDFPTQIFRK